jgi:hypothetical protein
MATAKPPATAPERRVPARRRAMSVRLQDGERRSGKLAAPVEEEVRKMFPGARS